MNQSPFTFLLLENAGKPQTVAQLVPVGANCCVVCTSRKQLDLG